MIAVTAASRIEGYQIVAYKGTAQGAAFEDLLKNAEALGANAVLNTCYDNALDVDTIFHGAAVVIEYIPLSAILDSRQAQLGFGHFTDRVSGNGEDKNAERRMLSRD